MTHFTNQIDPAGPILRVGVAVSAVRATALGAAGQTVPTPVFIRALVDTGASCTCIDPKILAQLNLSPTGKVSMVTPSTGANAQVADQYDVGLVIYGADPQQPPLLLAYVAGRRQRSATSGVRGTYWS